MKLGQGPLIPLEEKIIKDAITALVLDHGPDAVKWVWNKLTGEDPRLAPAPKPAKGGGGALVALAVVALATKKRRRR